MIHLPFICPSSAPTTSRQKSTHSENSGRARNRHRRDRHARDVVGDGGLDVLVGVFEVEKVAIAEIRARCEAAIGERKIRGGIGRLPDEATRKRMAALVDALPPTPPPSPPKPQQKPPQAPPQQTPQQTSVALSTAILDRYVGEYRYAAAGQNVTIRRDGNKLLMKVQGKMPEAALIARSETRFDLPWPDAAIEFKLDSKDPAKVTSANVEMGPNHMLLERK